jgi:hypothetical protein
MKQQKSKKGFLEKILLLVGIRPTEQNLLLVRILIVLVCGFIIIKLHSSETATRHGNYEEFKAEHPNLL